MAYWDMSPVQRFAQPVGRASGSWAAANLGTSGRKSKAKADDLFDKEGLPTRLPTSPDEALQFQFAAANWARRKNESMLANAQATMRYGLGMINKFGPYSAATMMNPLLGQMGQNYMNMQYDQPDYSYFMRRGGGGVSGGGGGGAFTPSGQIAPRSEWPVQWNFPQQEAIFPDPAAPVAQAPVNIPQQPNPYFQEQMPNDPEWTGAGVGSSDSFYGYVPTPDQQLHYELPEFPQ